MGTGVAVEVVFLDSAFLARLRRLSTMRLSRVLDAIGALSASHASERIQSKQGRAPDGSAWPDWSPAYAATRKSHHFLLLNEGNLQGSIMHKVLGSEVEVGTNLEYAAVHQYGYPPRNIPARPYLGVSKDDARDLSATIEAYLRRLGA